MSDELRHLPLEERHIALGARLMPFAGYHMPVQYAGIKEEHHAVRTNVGIFDVSHMGEIEFRGPDAVAAVDHLVTNDFSKVGDGEAQYSVMCNEDGGIVDDLIAYRISAEHILVCVNAANRAKDFEHMKRHTTGDVEVEDTSDSFVQLAVQGPNAEALLDPLTELDLPNFGFRRGAWSTVAGRRTFVTRGGYTGEDGFELYVGVADGGAVFDAVMERGEEFGLQPCGLGCRDTLRLEAKLLLYGSDMDETTDPFEAGLGWVVKLDQANFVGRDALLKKKAEGVTRRLRGLVLRDRGVLRPHYPIMVGERTVGETTSGSYSPTLDKSIGLGWIEVDHANDDTVEVEVRGRRLTTEVTKSPFYKRDKS